MESLLITDKNYDKKLNAMTVSCTMNVNEYLLLAGDRIRQSYYQRKVLPPSRNKVFKRLIQDLKDGCTIPTISLAVTHETKVNMQSTLDQISEVIKLTSSEDITILDGIQRTNCLLQVKNELTGTQLEGFLNSKIRLEIWMNISMMSLLYRMVALNAGQTNMTLRHQLEILNSPLKHRLLNINSELDLFEESKEVRKRVKPLQYQFADVVEGFMAFIQGDPEVDKQNEVAQRLERIEFLEIHSNNLINSNHEIELFAFIIGKLDKAICEKYQEVREIIPDYGNSYAIFGSLPTLIGICAAWGKGFQKYGYDYMLSINSSLIELLDNEDEQDPLSFSLFSEIKSKSTIKRIGEFERRLVFRTFIEYIEEKDPTKFDRYWSTAVKREGD